MSSLLKADLFALRKNKLTYILLAICAGMSLLTVGLYEVINIVFGELTAGDGEAFMEEMGMLVNGRTIMFGNFSLTNNVGLIIPIFAGLLTMRDVRSGTIRNKIIFGKSRVQIYFSHLIVSTLLCVAVSLIAFAILSFSGFVLFGYGVPFDAAEAWNFARCLIVGVLAYVYVASLATFFALVTKSTPLTIILTLAVCVGLGFLSGLSALIPSGWYDPLIRLVPTFASSKVATMCMLTDEEFALGVASFLIFSAANTAAGILLFKKTDLK